MAVRVFTESPGHDLFVVVLVHPSELDSASARQREYVRVNFQRRKGQPFVS